MTDVWGTILSKTPELASVLIVALFALQLTREQRESSSQIMKTWQEFIRTENDRIIGVLNAVTTAIQIVDRNVTHNTELLQSQNSLARKTQPRKQE